MWPSELQGGWAWGAWGEALCILSRQTYKTPSDVYGVIQEIGVTSVYTQRGTEVTGGIKLPIT